MLSPNRVSSWVARNSVSISTSGSTPLVLGSSTSLMSVVLSSRMSPSSGSFFCSISSAICSISRDFCTWYGISVTTIAQLPSRPSSRAQRARMRNPPRPVSYAVRIAMGSSTITPPVGKSGPGISASSSSRPASGFFTSSSAAAQTSPALCGGMLVAMPTAIPAAPLASRLGKLAGSTTGSLSSPS